MPEAAPLETPIEPPAEAESFIEVNTLISVTTDHTIDEAMIAAMTSPVEMANKMFPMDIKANVWGDGFGQSFKVRMTQEEFTVTFGKETFSCNRSNHTELADTVHIPVDIPVVPSTWRL